MPYQPNGLSNALCAQLDHFIANNNLPDLYRTYSWNNDTYQNGFPDIKRLESQLTANDASTGIAFNDVLDVARWGSMRNRARLAGPRIVLPPNTFTNANGGQPQGYIGPSPERPIINLENVRGLGPTYRSKILRFALPKEYGAIDTRVVRVFGQGDPASQQHNWLSLYATRGMHRGRATGWSIPATQAHWPSDFSVWTNILRYIACAMPNNCPHLDSFVLNGLRLQGVWACADVEMALFAYASNHV